MKKLLLLAGLLGMFTAPVFAAEDVAVVVNGSLWDMVKRDARHIFRGNSHRMLAARWMAGKCGIHEKSGGNAIKPMKAIAESVGLNMRWNGDAKTAYFMDKERVLYENEEFGIGVLLPEGVDEEGGFTVGTLDITEEGQTGRRFVVYFFTSEGAAVFQFAYFDLDYWGDEVRETFPISYQEIYRDGNGIWLCVNASDVQYGSDNAKQRAEYERLMSYKEEVCASFYTFTE